MEEQSENRKLDHKFNYFSIELNIYRKLVYFFQLFRTVKKVSDFLRRNEKKIILCRQIENLLEEEQFFRKSEKLWKHVFGANKPGNVYKKKQATFKRGFRRD